MSSESSSSSEEEFISLLISIQTSLFRYGGPILIIIGRVSCILSLLVFSQKTLLKSPCSVYFLALYIVNFLYIYLSLLPLTLQIGYNIDASAYNLIYCRFRLYVAVVLNALNAYYLILAAIDRVLVTSPNALTRRRSTHLFAYKCIISGTLFFILFFIHLLIFTTIEQIGPDTYFCYYQSGWHIMFMSCYAIFKETTAPILMITLGLWSVKNLRRIRRIQIDNSLTPNEHTVTSTSTSNSSRDRQLVFLIVKDVIIYILFTFIIAVSLLYDQATQNQLKSNEDIEKGNFLRYVAIFSVHIPFCIGCYTNLFVSKTFRHEMKNVFIYKLGC